MANRPIAFKDRRDFIRTARAVKRVEREPIEATLGQGSRTASTGVTWWPFVNEHESAVPPFGVVKVTGVQPVNVGGVLSWRYAVTQPDGEAGTYALNSDREVPQNRAGLLTLDDPGIAAHTSGSPAPGEFWGPVDASWELSPDGEGYRIVDALDSERKLAVVEPVDSTGLRPFELTEELTAGGSAQGKYLKYDAGWSIPDGADEVTFHDDVIGSFSGDSGARGLATVLPGADHPTIVQLAC